MRLLDLSLGEDWRHLGAGTSSRVGWATRLCVAFDPLALPLNGRSSQERERAERAPDMQAAIAGAGLGNALDGELRVAMLYQSWYE